MLHLVEDRALQAEEIAGKDEVENLTASVGQRLGAKHPAAQQREHVVTAAALRENGLAGLGVNFAGLERADELQFVRGERTKGRHRAQRAMLASNRSRMKTVRHATRTPFLRKENPKRLCLF